MVAQLALRPPAPQERRRPGRLRLQAQSTGDAGQPRILRLRNAARLRAERRHPALHLSGADAISGKQRGPRAVVPRARPARSRTKKAVVVLPHWNAPADGHNALCRGLSRLGISTLRISLPYHDYRMPAELQRADYAVSSNVCRTIDAARQAVIDVRCCLDWLETQGFDRFGIVGTSLGSSYACLASAHDHRISGERVQPLLHLRRRRGLDRPVHAAHPPEPGRAHRPGAPARSVDGHQPHQLPGQIRAPRHTSRCSFTPPTTLRFFPSSRATSSAR